MPAKKSIVVWITGFLTFLAALGSFGTIIYLINEGPNSPIKPYLIGDFMGQLRVEEYLWLFAAALFIFLGCTCIVAFRRLSPDPKIVKMFVKVGGTLSALRKSQEVTATELSAKVESNRTATEQFFRVTEANLENVRKEMFGELEKQRTTMLEVERFSKRSAENTKNQRMELQDIRTRLEKMEDQLMPPQPVLKSQDDPEQIKGIGPRLGKELKSIGITSVGDLITADPTTIDEKARISRDMAERFQAMAQLLLVPGVGENDAALLLEAGVTSVRELASKDPVSLSRKIGEITKIYVTEGKMAGNEKPTIEEISSWIKAAKY